MPMEDVHVTLFAICGTTATLNAIQAALEGWEVVYSSPLMRDAIGSDFHAALISFQGAPSGAVYD